MHIFLGFIFLIALWVSFVGFIIGLFSPTSSLFWFKDSPTRLMSIKIYGGIGLASLFALLLIAITSPNTKGTNKQQTGNRTSQAGSSTTQREEVKVNFIPGIEPIDVYGNFEKKGFETEENISPDGSIWNNTLEEDGMYFYVQTFCEKGVTDITEVRLSVNRTEPQYNTVSSMKQFLKYGCSLQYDGYDISKINKFIDDNYFNDKASIVISGIKFTISAPNEFSRTIYITPK